VTDKKQVSGKLPDGITGGDRSLDAAAEELFKHLQSEAGEPPASPEAIMIALRALKQPSAAADSQMALQAMSVERKRMHTPGACDICGHQNRPGNQFCGMCGLPLPEHQEVLSSPVSDDKALARQELPDTSAVTLASPPPNQTANGHHFYHHHYHHHYFPAGFEGSSSIPAGPRASTGDATRDPSRTRVSGAGAVLNRTEAAVRKVLQDWALACNTRHLDDLVSIYATDALLLRPNQPAVRGTAAIREFFVAALDAGFCEAELDPMRLEVFGDIAYEAGRCKALVPVAVSKRREERGKYLTLCARQSNGEWKIVADCWSSDLALAVGPEPDAMRAPSTVVPAKAVFPRKNP
jgi:uncharacterized protein (TIGR02246 family)